MSRHFFYCSEQSRNASEKAYGTASIGNLWLLIEYPHAWGPKALHDSALSVEVKTYLTKLVRAIPRTRVLFIKQERGRRAHLSFFIVRCRESLPSVERLKLQRHEELLDIDLDSYRQGGADARFAASNEPLFLVCTHGRRDKCCAKFGYPLYKSLRESQGEGVWQSSHVGGDRFAANLVCFPHGIFYAHVTDEKGKMLCAEYESKRVVLDGYRGRACYSYPLQAAEYFVRRETGITNLDALRFVSGERVGDGGRWRVRFSTPGDGRVHEAQLTGRASEFQNYITCHSVEERSVVQYELDDYHLHA